ncbi:MAG: DUF5671 domain-containing protein [bacterium]|nr:DUF5671 domain-containing protein [bacterium]
MNIQTILNPNKPKMGIGFFFLSLGSIITLITTVFSFLNLLFETLNKKFPDVLNASYQYGYNTYDYESMRSALATLIIFFPVFLVLTYFWHKVYKGGVGHIDEVIRKWMLYIILFLSSLMILVDLVTLVRYFIAGEITERFVYKVLATILVAVFVGWYYFLVLQKSEKFLKYNVNLWSMIKAIIWVALLVYFAFSVMGSPLQQRKFRLDEKRLQDLQNIQYQIINYFQQKQKLPESLKDLSNPLTGYSLPVDPEFTKGINYEYNVLDAKNLKFELCASFALPIPKGWQEYQNYGGGIRPMAFTEGKNVSISSPTIYPNGGFNESWEHEAGRACFERTIDKDLYPPYPKPAKDIQIY